ncbi:MAG: FHA domain-containing protein [Spirochaetales bacterium]|nr:FHA domain-containing protein [Spirochaetales bacterium]
MRLLLTLLLGGSGSLYARPELQVEHLDHSAHPVIELRLNQPGLRTEDLIVLETGAGKSAEGRLLSTLPATGPLHVLLVLDATLSLRPRAFALLKKQAGEIVTGLPEASTVSLYRINGQPMVLLTREKNRSLITEKIQSIKQTGKRTRIYDSLYAALSEGRNSVESGTRVLAILLTDGIDEGSYLTRDDCFELIGISSQKKIPVYVLLFDRGRDRALYARLALKSGGLIESGTVAGLKRIRTHWETLPESGTRVRYESRLALEKPGLNFFRDPTVKVQISLIGDARSAERTYALPTGKWISGIMEKENLGLTLLIALGLCALFLIVVFIVFMVVIALRRPVSDAPQPEGITETSASGPLLSESAPATPTVVGEAVNDDLSPLNESAPIDPYQIYIEQEKSDLLREGEPGPYRISIKDYAYRMLQNALREGKAYRSARLRYLGSKERVYDLFLDSTVIGRGPLANIHIQDRQMSDIHARIRKVDNKFIIYDMLSTAGVFINGKRILRPRALFDGDSLQMGSSRFEFEGRKISE